MAGVATSNLDSDFALARYTPDGSLDATFGVGGKVTTDFSGLNESAGALAIQSDGKIVAAGYVVQTGGPPYNTDFALARFNADGSLDTTFGFDGKVTTDFVGRHDAVRALAIQSDGRIVAAGMMVVPLMEHRILVYAVREAPLSGIPRMVHSTRHLAPVGKSSLKSWKPLRSTRRPSNPTEKLSPPATPSRWRPAAFFRGRQAATLRSSATMKTVRWTRRSVLKEK